MGYVAPTPPWINTHDSTLQGIDAAQNEVNMEQMLRSANAASAPPLIRRSLERRAAVSTHEADEETKVHRVQSPRLPVQIANGVINWKIKLLVWFILSAAIAMSFFLQPGLSSVMHTGEPCVAPYDNFTGVNASNGNDTAEALPPITATLLLCRRAPSRSAQDFTTTRNRHPNTRTVMVAASMNATAA